MAKAKGKELLKQIEALEELNKRLEHDRYGQFGPNAKQWEALNSPAHETLFAGPNQCGKTELMRYKAAMHLTGLYPKGYKGHKFTKPIVAAIGGETSQTTRDHLVNPILGPPDARGTGFIPADCLNLKTGIAKLSTAGVMGAIDYFLVKHHTDGEHDGWSKCYVFTYAKGWERLQGYTLDWIGIDEEPPGDVYNELKARTNFTMGYIDITMSPLKGDTQLYVSFEENSGGTQNLITYTIDDATHLSPEQDQFIRNRWKGHPQEEARLYGRPCRGTGAIYPYPDEMLSVDPMPIPKHWPQVIGLDFPHGVGVFAAAKLAHDPESDIVYLVSELKDENKELAIYAGRLKAMGGGEIPVAWPHDGNRMHTDGSTMASRYRDFGCQLMRDSAHYVSPDGTRSFAVMNIIEDLSSRMADGRFRVFKNCTSFLKEKRLYRHKDGKVAPRQDDHVIDATHKAVMMLRHARPPGAVNRPAKKLRGQTYEFFAH